MISDAITLPPDDGMWSRAHYDALDRALFDAAGDAVSRVSPQIFVTGPMMSLLCAGCDLDLDILPTIRARVRNKPAGSIKSWAFFTDAIRDARERRRQSTIAAERAPHVASRPQPDRSQRAQDTLLAAFAERAGRGGRAAGVEDQAGFAEGVDRGGTLDLIRNR